MISTYYDLRYYISAIDYFPKSPMDKHTHIAVLGRRRCSATSVGFIFWSKTMDRMRRFSSELILGGLSNLFLAFLVFLSSVLGVTFLHSILGIERFTMMSKADVLV